MSDLIRREFLRRSKHTGLALADGAAILADPRSVRATPANNKIALRDSQTV